MSFRGKERETNGLVLPGPEKIPGWRDSREETLHPPPRKEERRKLARNGRRHGILVLAPEPCFL